MRLFVWGVMCDVVLYVVSYENVINNDVQWLVYAAVCGRMRHGFLAKNKKGMNGNRQRVPKPNKLPPFYKNYF